MESFLERITEECADRSSREHQRISNLKTNLKLKKWKGSQVKIEKLLAESQLIIRNLTDETISLQSEIELLKSKTHLQKEKSNEIELNHAASKGIYSAEEVAHMCHINKLLKAEHELYRFENSHLVNSFKKSYGSKLDAKSSQSKVMKSLRKVQAKDIEKIRKDQSIKIKIESSKIINLEHDLVYEKEKHKNNVDEIKRELLRALNNRNKDLTRIFEALDALKIDSHIKESSYVSNALQSNTELINSME